MGDEYMKSLETVVLEILEARQPKTVKDLVQLVREQIDVDLEEIKETVKSLHRRGLVALEEPVHRNESFSSFVSLKNNIEFWLVNVVSVLAFASIRLIPEAGTPLSYIRYIFGFILVAFLPGYCLTETLFPKKDSLDIIERVTFSIGLSFAATALVGLFLSFTPISLTLYTALPTLGTLVLALNIIALIRKYKNQ